MSRSFIVCVLIAVACAAKQPQPTVKAVPTVTCPYDGPCPSPPCGWRKYVSAVYEWEDVGCLELSEIDKSEYAPEWDAGTERVVWRKMRPEPAPQESPVTAEWLNGKTVAVLGFAANPPQLQRCAETLTDHLRRTIQHAGNSLTVPKDLVEMELVFCEGVGQARPACMARAGKTLGADLVIYGTITGSSSQAEVQVTVVEIATQRVQKNVKREFSCDSAGEFAARLQKELLQ